jgi:hypothetical protein
MGIREETKGRCAASIRRARDGMLLSPVRTGRRALPAWALARGPDSVFAFVFFLLFVRTLFFFFFHFYLILF